MLLTLLNKVNNIVLPFDMYCNLVRHLLHKMLELSGKKTIFAEK